MQDQSPAVKAVMFASAGGLSGMVTKTVVAPLERVKLLYQVQGMYASGRYQTWYGSLGTIVKEDGVRGLYKGNGANIARILPAYSLKFMFNDTFKAMFLKPGQTPRDMGFLQLLGSGMLAGFCQASVTYPLETIRTRLSIDKQMGGNFRGIFHCGQHTVQERGVRALYQGFSVTFMSTPLYVGLQMALYDTFKSKMPCDADGRVGPLYSMLAGACAGLLAQTSAYWGDTVKKQMQADGVNGEKKYKGFIDCVTKIWRQGGVRAFYPGIILNSVKCIPEAGIQFAVYDAVKHQMGV